MASTETTYETPDYDYYCYFCPKCGTEYAGWGDLPEEFDPDNFCECPPETAEKEES